jgi:hypothetical protein
LLPKLRGYGLDNWRHLVTEDESWFDHEYVRDRIWAARDENTPEAENRAIASTQAVLTVLWNSHGFHVVNMLPPGELSNASWFKTWSLWFKVSFHLGGVQGIQFMVHIGNMPAHNSRLTRSFFEHNPLKRLPHPPYSPDIYQSDLYLFVKVRER